MKRVIHSGSYKIEILKWYECGPDNIFMEFDSPASAFSFLCGFTRDHFNMLTLRNALTDGFHCADICRSTDHEICQQVACQIADGHIKLVLIAEEAPPSSMGVTTSQSTAKDTDTTETPKPELPQAYIPTETPEPELPQAYIPTETPEEPEPGLVPEGAAATQSATMTEAAESGAPFCEI